MTLLLKRLRCWQDDGRGEQGHKCMAGQSVRAVIGRKIAAAARLLTDPAFRGVRLLSILPGGGAFQPFNDTCENRYPRIFQFLRTTLGDGEGLTILSFGCANGAEVFSLAYYFPGANIKGIDINAGNIAQAQKRLAATPNPRLSFAVARSADSEPANHYDAILCMAVFRDGRLGRLPARCDRYICFAAFEPALEGLALVLKPGGLLAIRNSHFRFSDTAVSARFETVLSLPYPPLSRPRPIYGPNNRLVHTDEYPDCVFRMRTSPPDGGPSGSGVQADQ